MTWKSTQMVWKRSSTILEALEKFGNALENQGKFYINYMKMFEVIFQFIQAPRKNL